ncbi:MAG TPA: hypothetical protein VFO78_13040 [Candidatus Limnocylindrales bacterium]|nr:hypothetical protein [Candidatus Limnocylindrales bacterium]
MTVFASLEPANLSVEPGSTASLTVRVRNSGSIVDRFELTVVGPLAAYAHSEPAALSLFPGQEGEARITFAPPRASTPRAGTFPYGVRVRAAADPGGATVEEGRVTIGPYNEATGEIVPVTSRSSRTGKHEVVIENRGNAPIDVLVGAADPDRLIEFEVRPDRFVIGPGERGGASIRASARDTFFLGSKQSHPFNVEIRPGKAAPITLRATLLQGPILPTWLVPAGGLALAAILALVIVPRLTGAGGPGTARASDVPSPTPSPSLVSEAPSAEISAPPAASASPSPSDAGQGSPTPTPPPGPFVLSLVGDALSTGGALAPRCPPEDTESQCVRDALDTIRALATTLGGPFAGRGIVSTENVAVANTLPVVMERDVPFPWLAQEGAITDQTPRIVIDLAPLVAIEKGFAYAVVDSAAGPRRFVLPDELAGQLLETLYVPDEGMVEPMPTRSLPPVFQPYDPGVLVFPFVFATPAP